MKTLSTFFMLLSVCLITAQEDKYVTVKQSVNLMGSTFEITVISLKEELGYVYIQEAISEIQRIERLISSWDPASETSKINANAGIKPVKVSRELYALIERSIQISEITNGAFDITIKPLEEIWKFDGSMKVIPSKGELTTLLKNVGYKKIVLNKSDQTVYLKNKGMAISFGAIGKGYAADKTKSLMVSKQVKAGVINADGDITTWGTKVSGENWVIGVVNPKSSEDLFSWFPILESSVATSGGDAQFMMVNNKKYNHLLDPKTGYPSSGISTVTVFSQSAELCDALATAIFVMGKDAGLALINQLGDTEIVLIDSDNQMHKSNGVNFSQTP